MTITREDFEQLERHAQQIALLVEYNKQSTRYITKDGTASFSNFRHHAVIYGIVVKS